MITTAKSVHLDGIRSLWQQAFGDRIEYINFFLENHAQLENTLVYLLGETVCGMLFMLPCHLVFGEKRYKAAYLYSVATRKEYQGNGISTELLNHAHDLCTSRGYDVCTLVPASQPLFDFYQKRGYATQGYIKTLELEPDSFVGIEVPCDLSPVTANEVFSIRQQYHSAYLEWDKVSLEYIISENHFVGGQFYKFNCGSESGFLSCVPTNNDLLIREFCGKETAIPQVLQKLHQHYHKQRYRLRLFHQSTIGQLTPFAMTKWLQPGPDQPFYLSHVLD